MNTDSITIIERQPVEYVENNRVYTLDELREMFGSVPGNVVVPLLDIITRLRTALAASQKTVKVLGDWQTTLARVLERLQRAASEQQHTITSRGWRTDPDGTKWALAGAVWHQYQEVSAAEADAVFVLEELAFGHEAPKPADPDARRAVEGTLCYPFSTNTCDDPKCNCRDEKRAAVEGTA